MTKTAHTPGPWKVIEDPFISVVTEWTVMDDDDPSSATYHTIVHDCDHDGWFDLSVPRANARLIAAAPDLLEALRAVKKIVDDAAEHPTGFLVADFQTATYPNSRDAYDGLCAAIAKAEGRS